MATAQRHIIPESRPYQWSREEYYNKMIFKEGDSVKPLAKPKVSIAVADLLP